MARPTLRIRQVIRSHHLAAGAKGGVKKKVLATQSGGFTTKIHLVANAHRLPVSAETSGEEASDLKDFDILADKYLPKAKVFLTD